MIKILKYGEVSNSEIFARVVPEVDVTAIVSEIIENVKTKGDEALFEYCEKFDKARLTSLEVTAQELRDAMTQVEPEFVEVLKKAAANIRKFHEKQI